MLSARQPHPFQKWCAGKDTGRLPQLHENAGVGDSIGIAVPPPCIQVRNFRAYEHLLYTPS